MSLESLPLHRGLRVPHVAAWTSEDDISPAVISLDGILRYVDPLVDAACRWRGALWRRLARAQGEGEPIFDALHPGRHRRAMAKQLCQVCGWPTAQEAADAGGALYLVGANSSSGIADSIREGERTENPPVHLACAWEAAQRCPHLLEGYTAARVTRPEQWGVGGILHMPVGGTVIPLQEDAEVAYDSPSIRWMLAEWAVVRLYGVTPVDLIAEAAHAGLRPLWGKR